MITREVLDAEREEYNRLVSHPCQSWEWGEFRKKTGAEVIRIGVFKKEQLVSAYQLTIHDTPYAKHAIGYLPRGPMVDGGMIATLRKIGREKNCIFFRIEPNVSIEQSDHRIIEKLGLQPSPRPFFYQYTFLIDLTKSEKELLEAMKQKTRYNLRLAQKHGVKVTEDNSDEAFEIYLQLLSETTRRQKFYAHTPHYHRQMWETLKPAGIVYLLKAEYQGEVLSVWILFKLHHVLYYPYGASSSLHRNVMANNLLMWEAIRFGKKRGCQTFDFWGCLGPNPDPEDSWYGFHRFKEGYGGKLVELAGSFDLILNPPLYKVYNLADNFRWQLLGLKSRLYEPTDKIKKFLGF